MQRRSSQQQQRSNSLIANLTSTRKAICSFTPYLLQEILANHVQHTLQPEAFEFDGVILLCDISGFTRLSGQFCVRKDGLDELSSILCGFMGRIIDCIYSFGGDVINFAGDALLVVFKPMRANNVGAFQRSCQDAVCCAWSLKDITTPTMTLHVGISCGPISFELLGGFDNTWSFLISGRCLQELSQCLEDAPSQHVAITNSVYSCLEATGYCHLFIDYIDGCLIQHAKNESADMTAVRLPSGNCLISHINNIKLIDQWETSVTASLSRRNSMSGGWVGG